MAATARGWHAAGSRTRPGVQLGLVIVTFAALAAGCAPSDTADESGTSPESETTVSADSMAAATDAPTDPDIPVPTVWVLTTPPGFEDVMPAELTSEWADVVTGSECVLRGRAGTRADAVDDMRAASVERLQQIAAEDDATVDAATDVALTTQGAGEGNDPNYVLTLVTADWRSGDEAARGLSRVGNLVLYDGSLVSQWLDLTFTCSGEIDEQAWTAVIDDVRPEMQVGEGWDGLAPGDG